MSDPFLAEVRLFSFNFAPRGWALCDGQVLPIGQNQSLYSLLGTTYGGDGRTTFALPDLRSRVPIHRGEGHTLGSRGGEETHTLTAAEMPSHTHTMAATGGAADSPTPAGGLLAGASLSAGTPYRSAAGADLDATMAPGAIGNSGSGQGHDTMMPYLTISFAIAIQGLFPSRN